MKIVILWYGSLFCIFLSPETIRAAGVYGRNRSTGFRRTDGYEEVVLEKLPVDGKLEGLNSKSSSAIEPDFAEALKTVRRKPRCCDDLPDSSQEMITPTQSAVKLPSWAGTLYHHKILHPYHNWNIVGDTGATYHS